MIDYLGERIEFFYEKKDSSEEKKLLWVGRKDSSQDIKIISVDGDANFDTNSFTYTYYDEKDRKRKFSVEICRRLYQRSIYKVYTRFT